MNMNRRLFPSQLRRRELEATGRGSSKRSQSILTGSESIAGRRCLQPRLRRTRTLLDCFRCDRLHA